MVCIAAFIILCLMSVVVAFLSIFRRDIGKRWWKTFKKAWGCVGKRLTLQKCETGFKEDIKNSILSKVIVKKPKLVKPISIGPEACSLSAEVCSIDGDSGPQNPIEAVGYWFSDWGEIFSAIPDKFRDWDNAKLDLRGIMVYASLDKNTKTAYDIFDPGCAVCLQSFRTQKETGFFNQYNVLLVPFPIQNGSGEFKYKNSKMISEYVMAAVYQGIPEGYKGSISPAFDIIDRIFTEKDEKHKSYQTLFNDYYSAEEAEETIKNWLIEFGYSDAELGEIESRAKSSEIAEIIAKNNDTVVNNIHAKGIPTMIYDGNKHTGAYKE